MGERRWHIFCSPKKTAGQLKKDPAKKRKGWGQSWEKKGVSSGNSKS